MVDARRQHFPAAPHLERAAGTTETREGARFQTGQATHPLSGWPYEILSHLLGLCFPHIIRAASIYPVLPARHNLRAFTISTTPWSRCYYPALWMRKLRLRQRKGHTSWRWTRCSPGSLSALITRDSIDLLLEGRQRWLSENSNMSIWAHHSETELMMMVMVVMAMVVMVLMGLLTVTIY